MHKLPCWASGINRNASNHKDIDHAHKMLAVEATKFELSPRATLWGFNCRTDSQFPDWDPYVKLLSGASAADAPYSVTLCGTKFADVITVFKVDLITPAGDPVLDPVDGGDGTGLVLVPDGANEFTFSSADVGILSLPIKAKVTPSGIASLIASQCRMEVSAIDSSTLVWDATNPGGIPTASGDYLLATVRFVGLPEENAAFGNKKAAVYDDDGCKLDEKDYEVFFPKAAKNHPGVAAGVINTPNWYYYWAGTAVPGYDHTSGMYSYGGSVARWGAEYNGDVDNPHFTFYDGAAGAYQFESAGLSVDTKGIDTMAVNLKHEKTHWSIDINWRPPTADWPTSGTWVGMDDNDEDQIPDVIEVAHAYLGLNPSTPSSFNPSFWLGDDEEFWCEWKARNTVGDASKDWANPGKQSQNTY